MQNNSLDTPALPVNRAADEDNAAGLFDLITALNEVYINSSLAKENELTYSDNNGGRILL